MTATVAQVMRTVNNYFATGYRATSWSITGGSVSPGELLSPGMWIAVSGSMFHDGVWQLDQWLGLSGVNANLPDETFFGRIYFLKPPQAFLDLCGRIAEFARNTPSDGLQSESFGEYSMSRASGKSGGVLTWEEAFADELRPWRKMFAEVEW